MKNTFGAVLKRLRLKAGFGLRRFAETIGMQPSNLSNIENNRRRAPDDEDRLREIAEALALVEGSDDWVAFFDAARQDGELPADVRNIANKRLIPALLRTVDNCQLNESQIAGLIEEIQEKYGRC